VPALGIDDAHALNLGQNLVFAPQSAVELEKIIVDGLKSGFYARAELDEFYLPEKAAYNRRTFMHDNFIYGYCDSCHSCSIAGYVAKAANSPLAKRVNSFGFSSCPISSLAAGFFSHPEMSHKKLFPGQIVLFRPAPGVAGLDPSFIRAQLAAYLSSTHDSRIYSAKGYPDRSATPWPAVKQPPRYGTGVYDSLILHTLSDSDRPAPLDLKPYRVLWEHKAGMTARMSAVVGLRSASLLREVKPALKAIEDLANAIRFQSIFGEVGLSPAARAKIAELLKNLRESEEVLLGRLVHEI